MSDVRDDSGLGCLILFMGWLGFVVLGVICQIIGYYGW